jgi:uncharacterized alpha-E superfamily protein
MLSRVADNLFWLGRYLERADNVARLADAHALASAEQLINDDYQSWSAIIDALGATEEFEVARTSNRSLRAQDFVISALDCPQSVRATLNQARQLARELREQISREVFEEINRLYLAGAEIDSVSPREYSAIVRRRIASVIGLFDHTVLRNEGAAWFRCGMYLERADMTSRIVDSKYYVVLPPTAEVEGPLDSAQWKSVLRSASALEAFRRLHREGVSGTLVADMLLFDPDFPRSLTFCLRELRASFEVAIGASASQPQVVEPMREIILLQLDLQAADIRGVIDTGLHEFLDVFQERIIAINAALRDHLFHPIVEPPTPPLAPSAQQQQGQN